MGRLFQQFQTMALRIWRDADCEVFNGVPIYYTGVDDLNNCVDAIDTIVPAARESGWTENLRGINISDHFVPSKYEGQYSHGYISVKSHPVFSEDIGNWVVCADNTGILLHEFVHHQHLVNQGNSIHQLNDNVKSQLKKQVSGYAAWNTAEAVAEICTGLSFGEEYPESIMMMYKFLDGPEPLSL